MKIIQQVFKLERSEYYTMHLGIINSVLPVKLSDKELEVLAAFMALDENIIKDDNFNSFARKIVREKLKPNLSSAGLSNHLKSMIDKGFLSKDSITNVITIKEFLKPEQDTQGYQFKISKI